MVRFFALVLLLSVCLSAVVLAQDGEKPLAEASDSAPKLAGDQKIYVPFEDLEKVFEKEGQGVFVPYAEFMKLWEKNLDRAPVPADPPVPWLVTRATYSGRVDGDLAVVSAEIEFETFTPGWSAVPLGFAGIAVGEARLGDEPATLEAVKDGYRVLVPDKGSYKLTLRFVTGLAKAEDARSLAFKVPPTPVSRLDFEIPEEGARVTVEPNLATTRTEAGSGTTRVMAYVGAADSVKLTWKPRPPEIKVGPALVFADANVTASVEEAALRVVADVSYRIHRAPVDRLRLAVPAGARVLFVEGENLRSWDLENGVLAVLLHKAAESAYRLSVTLETDLDETAPVAVPAIRALDVAREQGFVLVRGPNTVNVLPAATGLYRTDFSAVPGPARAKDLLFAWRYPAHPWTLALRITRVKPVVDVIGRTLITLDERRMTSNATFTYTVTRAGIFRLKLAVPEGVTVTEVSRDIVDDWRIETEDGERVLVLDLNQSRLGGFAINIASNRPVAIGDVPLPLLTPLDVRRIDGMVGVVRDEALKVETKDVAGLVPAGAAEFGAGATLAWRYRQADRKATLVLSLRDPEVTAKVATMLRAEENRISVTSRVTFSIKYARVDSFSFTLPEDLRDKVEITGNNIRQQPKEDADDGRFRQRIELQGKVMGEYSVEVRYDLPYEGLATGTEKKVKIPSLVVDDVELEEGVYAVYREPMLEIVSEEENVELIDPRELPAGVERQDVFLAFKYLAHPHALSLAVQKHEFLPVLMAVVHHMHLVTALNDEGVARTEMILQMRNNGLQFLSIALPGKARADSLEVWTMTKNRFVPRPETPQQGEDGAILVRMPPDAGPEDDFFVKVVYPTREDGLPGAIFHDFEYEAPVIQGGDVPVLGTTWHVYPPPDVKITQLGGSLTPVQRSDSWLSSVVANYTAMFRPRPVRGGVGSAGVPAQSLGIAELSPRGQVTLVFGGRSRSPTVEVTFADPGTFVTVKIAVLLLVLLLGVFGLRCGCRKSKVCYLSGTIGLPMLLIPISATGMAEVLTAVALGGFLAGLFWCGRALLPAIREWMARKPAPAPIAPPPAPEEAPEAPKKEE